MGVDPETAMREAADEHNSEIARKQKSTTDTLSSFWASNNLFTKCRNARHLFFYCAPDKETEGEEKI